MQFRISFKHKKPCKMGDMEIVRQFNSEVCISSFKLVLAWLMLFNTLLWGRVCVNASSKVYASIFFQLSTIYETKPPISKAKVASVTRLAVKAIKVDFFLRWTCFCGKKWIFARVQLLIIVVSLQYYKHVVQSIEKFAQKVSWKYCLTEAVLYILISRRDCV